MFVNKNLMFNIKNANIFKSLHGTEMEKEKEKGLRKYRRHGRICAGNNRVAGWLTSILT